MSDKSVILTGLRANNDLHIGNYFGAILPLIDQVHANKGKHQINLFIPDLHSITTEIDYSTLQKNIMNNLKIFVASGLPLKDKDVKLYRQSYISAHSELAWILDCFSGFGEMNRMAQFKEKSKIKAIEQAEFEHMKSEANRVKKLLEGVPSGQGRSFVGKEADEQMQETIKSLMRKLHFYISREEALRNVKIALLNYPVLMAADILLYDAKYIPVGDDQTQHLEFTRDIAQRMNKRFGEIFVVPESVKDQHKFFQKDQGLRIKDLVNPDKKMSKSDDSGKGIIFLSDSPKDAKAKIMNATTDSLNKVNYDPINQPGVSNLLMIFGLINGMSVGSASKGFAGQTKYGLFKGEVAEAVADFLEKLQSSYADTSEKSIHSKLKASESEMNIVANKTLERVQKAVGLR